MVKEILIQYGVELVVLIIAGTVLYKLQTKKPKLVSYMTNISSFQLPGPPPATVGTHTIIVQNNGRGAAEDIDVCHRQLPLIKVSPDIRYQIEVTHQGGTIIRFERLLPKQMIIISYLYTYTDNPTVFLPEYIKSKQVDAKVIQTVFSPIYSKKLRLMAAILMLMGSIFLLNILVELGKLVFKLVFK